MVGFKGGASMPVVAGVIRLSSRRENTKIEIEE